MSNWIELRRLKPMENVPINIKCEGISEDAIVHRNGEQWLVQDDSTDTPKEINITHWRYID